MPEGDDEFGRRPLALRLGSWRCRVGKARPRLGRSEKRRRRTEPSFDRR